MFTLKHYPLSIVITIAVVILSLVPFPHIELAEDVPLADKWTHMVMYAGISATIWFEYIRANKQVCILSLSLIGVIFPILLGGILELMQEYLTSTRSGEWLDFVADSIGACATAILGIVYLRLKGKN